MSLDRSTVAFVQAFNSRWRANTRHLFLAFQLALAADAGASSMIRTTQITVSFKNPFLLVGLDEEQPAGTYYIEIDEERIEGLSFPAYRRIQTWIHLHPKTGNPSLTQTMKIDPEELQAALRR